MATDLKTPRAQADLEEILGELEDKSPRKARALAVAIDKKCEALGLFPELGRSRNEILPGLRSTLVGKDHVLFYRIRGEVVHGRRDLPRILGEGAE
jgi:toxin ParE1/3/4